MKKGIIIGLATFDGVHKLKYMGFEKYPRKETGYTPIEVFDEFSDVSPALWNSLKKSILSNMIQAKKGEEK